MSNVKRQIMRLEKKIKKFNDWNLFQLEWQLRKQRKLTQNLGKLYEIGSNKNVYFSYPCFFISLQIYFILVQIFYSLTFFVHFEPPLKVQEFKETSYRKSRYIYFDFKILY